MASWRCLLILLVLFVAYSEAGRHKGGHHGDDDDDHRPKYDKDHDDDDHDKCGDDDDGGECGRRHWAKLMVILASIVLFLGIAIGVVICCVRYRKSRQQIESKPYSKKGDLYIVDIEQPPPYEEKPTAPPTVPSELSPPPGYPVVSDKPLPGKE